MYIKDQFPFFTNNPSTIYFDSAATSLKPYQVIDAEKNFLEKNSSNPHTTDYIKGYQATEMIAQTRTKLQKLINAAKPEEIIFTSGATHAINLLAFGIKHQLCEGDEILTTQLEHSANLLPWIVVANQQQAIIKTVALNQDFSIDIRSLKAQINSRTKVISFAHITNSVGSYNDVKKIIKHVRSIKKDIIIHVDVAQSIAHEVIDVQSWDVDFISWSAHKMYGPFGIGCLYGKYELLNCVEPIFYGGGMSMSIANNLQDFLLDSLPEKLEGGTPNISGIYAYHAALEFIEKQTLSVIKNHETMLKNYFVNQVKKTNLLTKIDFYNLETTAPLVLFNVRGINPQDITTFLDQKYNISVRGGANCVRLLANVIDNKLAIRASFAIYNTKAEIDVFIKALLDAENFLDGIF